MRILILNFILSTAVNGKIIRRESNRDTMIYTMARGFVNGGHSVTLAAADAFRPLSEETGTDFNTVYFPTRLNKIFKPHLLPAPKGFGKWLRANHRNFDMILSVDVFSVPTLIASRICPEKMLIWQEMAFHQHLLGGIPAKTWYNIIAPAFIKNIRIVPQSENAKDFISRYLPNVSNSIISHGSDAERFHISHNSDNSFVVISMLVARKQIDGIISHFAEFLRLSNDKNFKLNIIGEGPEKEKLEELVEQLGIKQNVIFHGFLDHESIADISRKAKALLINTRQDNNMVSIPESIINGTPILTTCIPNNSVFITDYGLGIAKDNWTHKELQAMIDRYNEFHSNCSRHRDKFTNTGVAKALIDEFRR